MKRILVVDDLDQYLILIKTMLEHKNMVHTAANGRIAKTMIKRHNYDLVITDFDMPEMDGGRLVEAHPEKAFIVMSGIKANLAKFDSSKNVIGTLVKNTDFFDELHLMITGFKRKEGLACEKRPNAN